MSDNLPAIFEQMPDPQAAPELMTMAYLVLELFPDLPFISITPDGRQIVRFWDVAPTGRVDFDEQRGINFAEMALTVSKHCPEMRAFVGVVLTDIVRQGRQGPVEIGFLIKISQAALAGSLN